MSRLTKRPKILVILGSTASGKSALAVKLAKKFNGEVISADSRQVYKGLDIGSGKVPRDNSKVKNQKSKLQFKIQNKRKGYFYKGIRHHLLDVASPKRTFTVAQYQRLARKALRDILRRGKLPIICGGTGFYIDALLYDWELPRVKPNLKLRKKLEKLSADELFVKLQKIDPRRAGTIDRRNKRRLVRALEIVLQTGATIPPLEPKSHSYILKNVRMGRGDVLKIGINVSSAELKKRIHKRLVHRLHQGMIGEVKKLRERDLSWERLDSFGLEYRYVSRYLRGLISKKEMDELIEHESWHYAKRQRRWWKRDKEIVWLRNQNKIMKLMRKFLF